LAKRGKACPGWSLAKLQRKQQLSRVAHALRGRDGVLVPWVWVLRRLLTRGPSAHSPYASANSNAQVSHSKRPVRFKTSCFFRWSSLSFRSRLRWTRIRIGSSAASSSPSSAGV
jgi:hypothetical protein